MFANPRTISSKVGIFTAVAAVVAVGAGCTAPAKPPQQFGYLATAYGSAASGSLGLTSAPTFVAGVGCTTKAGQDVNNSGAASTLPQIGSVGAIKSRATTSKNATSIAAGASEDVAGANLLGGLIQAGAIHVTSVTSHSAVGFHGAGTTTIPSLTVAGHTISGAIGPNTVITLAGLGTVTLNEQSASSNSVRANQSTTAIHIRISVANSLHLPIGTDVVVGATNSGLGGPVAAVVTGESYGSSVSGDVAHATAASGPSAPVGMGCFGTNGQLVTRSQAGVSIPGAATSGTITDTARGTVNSKAANAELASTVQGASLLSSVVSAGLIKADVHASSSGGKAPTFSDAGSQLTNLVVAGHGGNLDNVPANTTLTIPGVGVLYLHRVIKTPTSIEVHMIELVVTTGGNNLPVGADIIVGFAEVAIP